MELSRNLSFVVGVKKMTKSMHTGLDLSLSALISWFMKSIIEFLNNSNLHLIISKLLIINLNWVLKIYFAVEEIYNNVGQQF